MFFDNNISGMFSAQGKGAVNKFSILKRKDELLQGFKLTAKLPKFNKAKIELKKPHIHKHKLINQNLSNYIDPTCTKYTPSYNYIYKNPNLVLNWNTTSGVKIPKNNKDNNSSSSCDSMIIRNLKNSKNSNKIKRFKVKELSEEKDGSEIKNYTQSKPKILVNMAKMTSRKTNYIKKNDLYILKPNISTSSNKTFAEKINFKQIRLNKFNKKSASDVGRSSYSSSNNQSMEKINSTTVSKYPNYKSEFIPNIKKIFTSTINNSTLKQTKSEQINEIKPKKQKKRKIKAPDFSKILSRKKLESIQQKPLCAPQFCSLPTQNNKKIHFNFSKIISRIDDTKPSHTSVPDDYDPNTVLDKINNYKRPITYFFLGTNPDKTIKKPKYNVNYLNGTINKFEFDFDEKKSSATTKTNTEIEFFKNKLPEYMLHIKNNLNFNVKSLILNNYKNSKMYSHDELFLSSIKKSFNELIKYDNTEKDNELNNFITDESFKLINTKLSKRSKYYKYNLDNTIRVKARNLNGITMTSTKSDRIPSLYQSKEFENFKLNFNK